MARLRAALEDADAVVLAEEMANLEELRSRLYREAQDAITSGTPGERVRHEVLMAIREVAGAISEEVYRYLAADEEKVFMSVDPASKKIHVVVWADGKIEFFDNEPEGGISIAEVNGMDIALEALRDVAVLTTNGYVAQEVHDARVSGGDAVEALLKFQRRFKNALREVYR